MMTSQQIQYTKGYHVSSI